MGGWKGSFCPSRCYMREKRMIVQPKRDESINEWLYESERKRIKELNEQFFFDVDLTKDENKVLVWLCRWDEYTHINIMSVFQKIIDKKEKGC